MQKITSFEIRINLMHKLIKSLKFKQNKASNRNIL